VKQAVDDLTDIFKDILLTSIFTVADIAKIPQTIIFSKDGYFLEKLYTV
jgi:hypothetical protein